MSAALAPSFVRAHLGTRLTLVLLIAIPVFLFEFVESGRPQLGDQRAQAIDLGVRHPRDGKLHVLGLGDGTHGVSFEKTSLARAEAGGLTDGAADHRHGVDPRRCRAGCFYRAGR